MRWPSSRCRSPRTTLPVAPDPAICNPSLPFPEMTCSVAPAIDPPIVFVRPIDQHALAGRSPRPIDPDGSVPMKLAAITSLLPVTSIPSWSNWAMSRPSTVVSLASTTSPLDPLAVLAPFSSTSGVPV